MRKLLFLFFSILLMVSIFVSCGVKDNSQSEPQESDETQVKEEIAEEEVAETHYTENQTEMSNYMNRNYALINNGWLYTNGWGADTTKPLFLKMRTDGTEDSVLRYYEGARYINVRGEFIYAVLYGDNTSNIFRYRLGGEKEKQLVENADYFQIVEDNLYYCKRDSAGKIINYRKSDLEGKNEEIVLDRAIYFPYLIDNTLFYQDDADGETIHMYDLETKEDKRITDKRTYQYVLNDDYMYCIEYDGAVDDTNDKGKLAKINLETLEREVLYEGAVDGSLAVKDDLIYFINQNDEFRIYSIDKNGENINLVTQDNYCFAPCIYDDKMIYLDASSNYEHAEDLYICNLDGSGKKSIAKYY